MVSNVLVAVDLNLEPARFVLAKAKEFSSAKGSMEVVHVVEPQYVQYSFDPSFTGSLTRSLEEEALAGAAKRLAEVCQPLDVPAAHQHVVLGRVAQKIHELAEQLDCAAIIIGSHSQTGWRRLLGSTANSVLHGAPVDVLVVRCDPD